MAKNKNFKKILGLVGETGSGKDTICEIVNDLVPSVSCLRFSDPLSQVLRIFFDEVKKEDQQWLATALRERFGNDILGKAIKKQIEKIKTGWVLVNGIRALEEYEMLKSLKAKIAYVTADSKIRWQRIRGRGEKKDDAVTYQKFLKLERAKTEILIPKIGEKADFKIENNGSKVALQQKISEIINQL